MFIEVAPSGQLVKTYRKVIKEAGLKIRVVERARRSLKKLLTKSDPFREDKCNHNKYKACKLNSNANCKGREVVYQMKFQGYTGRNVHDRLYIGKTARSIGERTSENVNKYEIEGGNLIFHKYVEEKNGGGGDKRWN